MEGAISFKALTDIKVIIFYSLFILQSIGTKGYIMYYDMTCMFM